MGEELEMRERKRQRLALLELQMDVLQREFALYRAEEMVERKGPQPAGPASRIALVKAG